MTVVAIIQVTIVAIIEVDIEVMAVVKEAVQLVEVVL